MTLTDRLMALPEGELKKFKIRGREWMVKWTGWYPAAIDPLGREDIGLAGQWIALATNHSEAFYATAACIGQRRVARRVARRMGLNRLVEML